MSDQRTAPDPRIRRASAARTYTARLPERIAAIRIEHPTGTAVLVSEALDEQEQTTARAMAFALAYARGREAVSPAVVVTISDVLAAVIESMDQPDELDLDALAQESPSV